jgi:uncharacterized protein (DUF58 family)
MTERADATMSPAGVRPGAKAGGVALTTRGRCLLAGGIATAACAVPLDERDLLRVGAFVALLPLLAMVLAALSRRSVRVHRRVDPPRVPVGGRATVGLLVSGTAALGPLELTDTVPDAAGAGSTPRFLAVPRPAGTMVRYPLRPVLRGAHRIGPLVARGADPLGLAAFARTAPGTERLLVLPRVVALRGLPPSLGTTEGDHGAGAAGTGHGRADVLVRPYRTGDELRRVHWRSTARHGELMVRLEERPRRGGITVLLDRRAQAHRGHGPGASLEWAVSFVASVGVHLLGRGEPVALVTEDGGKLPAGDGTGVDGLLDALATLRPSARTALDGPVLPGSGDVLAVLGVAAPDEVATLLARCPGRGHAVLLDVPAWGATRAPVFTAGASPVGATAAALRSAGWVVTVARRDALPHRVWDELVAAPVPHAGAS